MVECKYCGAKVVPIKKFNILAFILLLILGVIPGIMYLIYFAGKSGKKCPNCKKDVYKTKEEQLGVIIGAVVMIIVALIMILVIGG